MSALQKFKKQAQDLEKEVLRLQEEKAKLQQKLTQLEGEFNALVAMSIAPIGEDHARASFLLQKLYPHLAETLKNPPSLLFDGLMYNLERK